MQRILTYFVRGSSVQMRGATIAQWIHLRLPSCHPGFESQAHHLCFYHFIFELCCVEKTKIHQKEARIDPLKKFFKYFLRLPVRVAEVMARDEVVWMGVAAGGLYGFVGIRTITSRSRRTWQSETMSFWLLTS